VELYLRPIHFFQSVVRQCGNFQQRTEMCSFEQLAQHSIPPDVVPLSRNLLINILLGSSPPSAIMALGGFFCLAGRALLYAAWRQVEIAAEAAPTAQK